MEKSDEVFGQLHTTRPEQRYMKASVPKNDRSVVP